MSIGPVSTKDYLGTSQPVKPSGKQADASFGDFIDIINPLQHIPIISTIYRNITGDTIGAVPRILGGGLFGGIIGLASSVVNEAVEEGTGKDIGDHIFGAVATDKLVGSRKDDITLDDAALEDHLVMASLKNEEAQTSSDSGSVRATTADWLRADIGFKAAERVRSHGNYNKTSITV